MGLLAGLGVVFVIVGDRGGAGDGGHIVMLAVVLRIWQQTRSTKATRALRKLVTSTVTVRRRADEHQEPVEREIPCEDLVPGDIVILRPGDVVAADLRIISSTDLVVDQAVLSGESLPVAKAPPATTIEPDGRAQTPLVDTAISVFPGPPWSGVRQPPWSSRPAEPPITVRLRAVRPGCVPSPASTAVCAQSAGRFFASCS